VIENLGGEKAIRLACPLAGRHAPFRAGQVREKRIKK